jgi:hypothetical protein
MIAIISCHDEVNGEVGDVQVDTDRYKVDAAYRCEIHEKLDIADGQEPLDWDYLLATEDELDARGEKSIFDSGNYASEEAAMEALDKLLTEIMEEVEHNVAAETQSRTACAP